MYTDPNYVKALFDAKMQEVNQLADYFDKKDKASISCLNRLNEMFLSDAFETVQYNSLNAGFKNSKSELLLDKTSGGITLYVKATEAFTLCEIYIELTLG